MSTPEVDARELHRAALTAVQAWVNSAISGLVDVIDAEAWREFRSFMGPGMVRHESLRSYIEAKPNSGLGLNAGALEVLLRETNLQAKASKIRQALKAEADEAAYREWLLQESDDAAAAGVSSTSAEAGGS